MARSDEEVPDTGVRVLAERISEFAAEWFIQKSAPQPERADRVRLVDDHVAACVPAGDRHREGATEEQCQVC